MDNNQTSLTKNTYFLNAVDYLLDQGIVDNQKDLSIKTGISESAISNITRNKKAVSIQTVQKLCDAFPGIFYLPYFRGNSDCMLLEDYVNNPEYKVTTVYEPSDEVERNLSPKGRPYYAVDFAAGFDILENDQTNTPSFYINFPPYNDCDCWCNARGNSMDPTISSGDLIAMKRIHDFRYLINGEIYGIVTSNGLRTIKRVRDNGRTLTLIPDNKEIPEQTIPKEIITNVFIIKGSIKQF
jgi:SOS-response transcriptional repressor LexA